MGWSNIEAPVRKSAGRVTADVAIGIGGRPMHPKLIVSLRAAAMPKGWVAGTRVAALLGGGEHHGLLKIEANELGGFTLARPTLGKERLLLRLPLPQGVMPGKRAPAEARFTTPKGTELLITLPAFATPPKAAVASASLIATPKR